MTAPTASTKAAPPRVCRRCAVGARALLCALLVTLALGAEPVRADEPVDGSAWWQAATRAAALGMRSGAAELLALQGMSAFERRMVQRVLREQGLSLDFEPEGKRIGALRIAPQEVFADDDLFPLWFNALHTTTRPAVVERNLLLEEGQLYQTWRVDEARRALLDPMLFSTVQLVPVKSERPDEVELLVLSRDLWSLRFNSQFQLTGSHLDYLAASISENNLFGRNMLLAASFLLEPDVFSMGPSYVDKNLFGTRHSLFEVLKFSFNREDGSFEGAYGLLELGLPLYSLASRWGWSVGVSFRDLLERQHSAGALLRFPTDGGEEEASLPWVYRDRWLTLSAALTHAFRRNGEQLDNAEPELQHELSWGWLVELRAPEIPNEQQLDPALVARFREQVLPGARRDSYPFVRYRVWQPRFCNYLELDTMGLVEEQRLGPELAVHWGAGHHFWGSEAPFLLGSLELAYRSQLLGDDLFVWEGLGRSRLQSLGWADSVFAMAIRYATPKLGFGRLHVAGRLEAHVDDPDRVVLTLGGDNGLRGHASSQWLGSQMWRANVEWRSPGMELWTTQLGAVAFWDLGDAFEQWQRAGLHQGLGLGLRWLLPQFNRVVARLDWGFPLDAQQVWPGRLALGFEQAF